MTEKKFLQLFERSLPPQCSYAEIYSLAPAALWQKNPKYAAITSLCRYESIDWTAYLANYPDVANSGQSPIEHFINDGIFEQRKLFYRDRVLIESTAEVDNKPLISVIISNYNNALYIGKCLRSVLGQTLKNIEIIFIDDNSTDKSIDLAKSILDGDERVKIIIFSKNSSQHMTRKIGVKHASGQYIMFIDSDDYYYPYTCETAYKYIKKGYDIVSFNIHLVPPYQANMEEEEHLRQWCNRGKPGLYTGTEILWSIYYEKSLNSCINARIYKADLAKRAFELMEEGYYPRGQDEYQSFVLSSQAKTILKIDDELYNYHTHVGISTSDSSEYKLEQFKRTCDLIKPVVRYLQAHGLNTYYDLIVPSYMIKPFQAIFKDVPPNKITDFFDHIVKLYGIIPVLNFILDHYFDDRDKFSKIWKNYQIRCKKEKIKTIGILYSSLKGGGIEKLLPLYCDILVENGYNVIILLEKCSDKDSILNKSVRIVYLPPYVYGKDEIKERLLRLNQYIKCYEIDIMMYQWWGYPSLLWETILFQASGLSVFLFFHSDFCRPLITPYNGYPQYMIESVLQCIDKVICLSNYTELYLHMRQVNAIYLPNPVQVERYTNLVPSFKARKLIAIGNFSRPLKQPNLLLHILARVKQIYKDITLTIIGDLGNGKAAKSFMNLTRYLGLSSSVHVTGWVDDVSEFVRDASLYLGVSQTESFSLSLCEAQAAGLPAVIFELPIMPALNNESVISVPQDNINKAAEEIIALLGDYDRWHKLSKKAREAAARYPVEEFKRDFIYLLNNFDKLSPIKKNNDTDYRTIIKTLAFNVDRLHSSPFK